MGYACPVCTDPQADTVHLANHLAFTALARGGDHEDWLDDHVPDWERLDEATLGERVTEYATDTEFPQVFEDTTDRTAHDHGESDPNGDVPPEVLDGARSQMPDEAAEDAPQDVLERARELTRARRENAEDDSENE